MSILDSIDRAIGGVCPCGADPRPGSAYCSADCEPTWRGEHTTSDTDGTAMRWRPDLVTDHDDSRLRRIDWSGRNGYTGLHNAAVYERSPGTWHLRLDDGHRYVGLDIDSGMHEGELLDPTVVGRIYDAWQRLERELSDQRRLETGSAYPRLRDEMHVHWAAGNPEHPGSRLHAEQRANAEILFAPVGTPLDDRSAWQVIGTTDGLRFSPSTVEAITQTFNNAVAAIRQFSEAVRPIYTQMRHLQASVHEAADTEGLHPLARVTAQRRNTSYGPPQRQRPPRHLGPRGR